MKLPRSLAGAPAGETAIDVTPRWIMNFAAGVPDPNPRYFDDIRYALTAPPTFPCALTWQLSRLLPHSLRCIGLPDGAFQRQLHAMEHLELTRPIRAGERAHIRGTVIALAQKRKGSLLTVRYDATDGNGAALFTEHHSIILQGVECFDAQIAPVPVAPAEGPPSTDWEARISLDALACYHYDAGADIDFDVHTSAAYARKFYGSAPILHGTCTAGLMVREVVDRLLGGDGARVKAINCRFTKPVVPPQCLVVRGTSREGRATVTAQTNAGEAAIMAVEFHP